MLSEYLRIFCLSIIDDLNEKHKGVAPRSEKLKQISKDYSETDFSFRIGYFFRERVTFEQKDSKRESKDVLHGHNDIHVPSKDFKIEVKFAKSHKSESGKDDNKLPWDQVIGDFRWLEQEILHDNKGKRAFVIGWFNTAEINKLIQIGEGGGRHPIVGLDKGLFFPFIDFDTISRRTDTVKINYEKTGEKLKIENPDSCGEMNCIFLGNKEDLFHIALYY
jgi:hypothetical protein